MPARNEDLHGNAPDKSPVALLLIDVINDLEFPEGDQLLRHALPMAQQIAALKRRARQGGIPVVYVNDNFGRWRSDFSAQVEHCLHDGVRGRPVVDLGSLGAAFVLRRVVGPGESVGDVPRLYWPGYAYPPMAGETFGRLAGDSVRADSAASDTAAAAP